MPGIRRLWTLVLVHAVMGIGAAFAAQVVVPQEYDLRRLLPPYGFERILAVPMVALVLAQSVLLSIWVVGSTGVPAVRLAGLLVGAAFLEALSQAAMLREIIGLVPVTVGVTTASLLLCRAAGFRITRLSRMEDSVDPETAAFQFSIRSLMSLTVLVGVLTAGARALQEYLLGVVLLTVFWGLCFVVVGLVSLWSVLGGGRPHRRWPGVMILSPGLGGLFAHLAHAHASGRFYLLSVMLLFPIILLSSLAVVRSCGYRIVRRVDQADGAGLAARV